MVRGSDREADSTAPMFLGPCNVSHGQGVQGGRRSDQVVVAGQASNPVKTTLNVHTFLLAFPPFHRLFHCCPFLASTCLFSQYFLFSFRSHYPQQSDPEGEYA